jgi:hypothetical protein
MNGPQRAVLWIGLILVGLNLVKHWKDVAGVIFSGSGGFGISGTGSGGGGFNLPGIPGIGFPPGIGILSQPTHSTKKSNVQIM